MRIADAGHAATAIVEFNYDNIVDLIMLFIADFDDD